MGYEEIVPPIPDREQQIHALNNLQKSWFSQPYYKYYMNESLRVPKLNFSEKLNSVYRTYWWNVVASVLILAPVALFSRRFFISRGGLPMTYVPDYFRKVRSDNYIREVSYNKIVLPLHIVGSLFLAAGLTDWTPITDVNYEFVHKSPKIM